MRKGFDDLSGRVLSTLNGDPLSGDVFFFVNRRRNRMKLLVWDRSGFVVWHKRWSEAHSSFPKQPKAVKRCTLTGENWC